MLLCCLLLAAVSFTGCQHTQPYYADLDLEGVSAPGISTATFREELDPELLQPPTDFYTLGPGDRLEIELIGEAASRTITVVGPDGRIYFNLLPGIDVWGMTLSEAKAALERGLAEYIRDSPQVSVVLRGIESKRVWLLGRFQAPGVYPLTAPTTLLEAIALAGGTLSLVGRDVDVATAGEELADLQRSFIVRDGQFLPVDFDRLINHGDLSQNIYLRPDDFVYLPPLAAKEVYVLGAVVQPRAVPWTEHLTLVGAVSGAFGTIRDAHITQVGLVRGSLTQPQVATVNYRAIVRGQSSDVQLQPRDIVYVPYAPYRHLRRYADLALNAFVSSAAINAGLKAVVRAPDAPAGVFIPVGTQIQIINPPPPPR